MIRVLILASADWDRDEKKISVAARKEMFKPLSWHHRCPFALELFTFSSTYSGTTIDIQQLDFIFSRFEITTTTTLEIQCCARNMLNEMFISEKNERMETGVQVEEPVSGCRAGGATQRILNHKQFN